MVPTDARRGGRRGELKPFNANLRVEIVERAKQMAREVGADRGEDLSVSRLIDELLEAAVERHERRKGTDGR